MRITCDAPGATDVPCAKDVRGWNTSQFREMRETIISIGEGSAPLRTGIQDPKREAENVREDLIEGIPGDD